MEKWLTAPQLLQAAEARGIPITMRTLRLYAGMGLIPRPEVRPGAAGGRTGYYSPRVLDLLSVVERLKQSGQSLEQSKEFVDRLGEIARQTGRDPLEVQAEALDAIAPGRTEDPGISEPRRPIPFLRALGGRVTAEMVKHGLFGVENVTGMDLVIQTRGNETVSIPLYLDPRVLQINAPTREDDSALSSVVQAYYAEVSGQRAAAWSTEDIRGWLEKTYDMSRANFILARRPSGQMVGFAALGVEPERIRAGQVRLEGPYTVPEYRGQGIGEELMSLAEQKALSLGAAYIDSFKDSGADMAISFLKRFGFRPEFYEWIARCQVRPTAAADYQKAVRGKKVIDVRPLQDRSDLELTLDLQDRVAGGTPGHYRVLPDDLLSHGFALPARNHFLCFVDGEAVGSLWSQRQNAGSARVYAVVLPSYRGTWVESAMWKYLLKHAAEQGFTSIVTDAVSTTGEQSKAALGVGFVTQKMRVCYRKRFSDES